MPTPPGRDTSPLERCRPPLSTTPYLFCDNLAAVMLSDSNITTVLGLPQRSCTTPLHGRLGTAWRFCLSYCLRLCATDGLKKTVPSAE